MARTTKAKTKDELIKEDKTAEVKVEKITPAKEEVKTHKRISRRTRQEVETTLDKSRRVPVVSVCGFPVKYNCKKEHLALRWSESGDEHTMTIEEVLIMNSQSKKFLQSPWLIVDDEEFVEYMGWKNIYELIFEIEDLNSFYSQHLITVERKLKELPEGIRKDVINKTVTMINNGELSNFGVVRLLKQKYNIDVEI